MENIPTITETTDNIEKLGNAWKKNPWGITVALAIATFIGGFVFGKYDKDTKDWKILYEQEKLRADRIQAERDEFNSLLFLKAGLIEKQSEIIKKADSTLRQKTQVEAENILNTP